MRLPQKDAVRHTRGRRQLQPAARGAPGRVRLGRGTAPWRLNTAPDLFLIVRSLPRTFPQRDEGGQTWSLFFDFVCLSSGWRMPNKQSWFGDNPSVVFVYGLKSSPETLFSTQHGCSKTILENAKASDGTLDGEPLGSGDVCLHLKRKKKKKIIDIIQLSYEREKNDSSKIAKMASAFFSHFTF